ncbi:MAG: hypothetical protein K2K21_04890 [Lachnospiraceae bacterium]|nr:hypothetical protein [Lachnospiraceae bacterium]
MKITITITLPQRDRSYDIQMEDTQKITDTLQVLQDNLLLFRHAEQIRTVREKETGRQINTEQTYEQAMIYSGAELLIYE